MKKKREKILIFGATSDMALPLIKKFNNDGSEIYAVSRSKLDLEYEKLYKFNCDLSLEKNINSLFEKFPPIEFDAVINFQGVAISSPVEFLQKEELQKQLDISLFSLLAILKNLNGKIKEDGIIINISSMASFGIYPFLSPYSMAKASADILLNCYETETGIKTVSIKPGVVRTKFWEFCVKENSENFEKFKGKYEKAGEFLKSNALKNANKGILPEDVSKVIYKAVLSKNPKSSITVGQDAFIASIVSNFKGRLLFAIIRKILKKRIKGFLNEKK